MGTIKGERVMALDVAIEVVKAEINKHETRILYLQNDLKEPLSTSEDLAVTRKYISRRRERVDELMFTLEQLLIIKNEKRK